MEDLFNKKSKNNEEDNGLFVDNDFGDDDDDDYEDDFEDDKHKSNQKKHDDIFNKSKDKNDVPAATDKSKKSQEVVNKPEDKKVAVEPKKEAAGIKATGSL